MSVVPLCKLSYTLPRISSCGLRLKAQVSAAHRGDSDHYCTFAWIKSMQDDAHILSLSLDEITSRCASETTRFRQDRQKHDTRFCLELFRRALTQNDQAAYAQICRSYADMVAGWVRSRLNADASNEDVEECVNWAFASMFRSLGQPGAFERFSALDRLLGYLRSCAFSAAQNVNRKARVQESELSDELAGELVGSEGDPLGPILQAAQADTIRQLVNALLKDERERMVYECYFTMDLPPRTIFEMFPALFRNIQDVHRVKQIMLERLSRTLTKARPELGL